MKIKRSRIRTLVKEAIKSGGKLKETAYGQRGKVEPSNAGAGAGYQRDDESADQREDHNIDDLWAMVRNLKRELDDLKKRK